MGQSLPGTHSLVLPNLVPGMSDIGPYFKGQGEKWFLSVLMAASALARGGRMQRGCGRKDLKAALLLFTSGNDFSFLCKGPRQLRNRAGHSIHMPL